MARLTHFTVLAALLFGWASALAEGVVAESGAESELRQPRGIIKKLIKCRRFGICGGGNEGGYSGHQGYPGQIPAINIGISQSQSSSSAGSGGYSAGNYPNNYQYNNQGPYGGYNQGPYGGYNQGPHGGYNQGPYGGYNQGFQRPYYGNGNGGYNNQFNGNYYGGGQNGGYGFQGPYGYSDEYSEDNKPQNDLGNGPESEDYNLNSESYEGGQGSYAGAGSFAYSRSAAVGRKS